ncbi:pyridoxamine 5'-phosphate oxidase family protein [Spirochaetota bacterium]
MEDNLNEKFESTFKDLIKGKVKKVSKEKLKEEINRYISKHCICTLATCADNIPRATVLRYGYKDFTLYILSEGGGKIRNIKENPGVSVTIYGEYTGFQSVNSLQIWGNAKLIHPDEHEKFKEVMEVMKTEERQDLKNMGATEVKIKMYAIKIQIEKARYLNLPEGIINKSIEVK